MTKYTFTGPSGRITTVAANDESYARHLAMVKRWGPPTGIYGATGIYEGRGLNLVEVNKEK